MWRDFVLKSATLDQRLHLRVDGDGVGVVGGCSLIRSIINSYTLTHIVSLFLDMVQTLG